MSVFVLPNSPLGEDSELKAPDLSGTGAITSTSTLTCSGKKAITPGPAAALSSTTTLTCAGTKKVTPGPAAALTSTTALAEAGTKAAHGTSALTAATTLAATGRDNEAGAASLTTAPTLAAAGRKAAAGTSSLTGATALAEAGTKAAHGSAALTTTPSTSATGGEARSGAGTITTTPTLAAAGTKQGSGAAILAPLVRLAAAGRRLLTRIAPPPRLTLKAELRRDGEVSFHIEVSGRPLLLIEPGEAELSSEAAPSLFTIGTEADVQEVELQHISAAFAFSASCAENNVMARKLTLADRRRDDHETLQLLGVIPAGIPAGA